MKVPSIKAVSECLINIKTYLSNNDECDVRLNIQGDGWNVLWGPSDYDSDHRGFWGCSCLDRKSNAREVAKDLIEQVKDQISESEV